MWYQELQARVYQGQVDFTTIRRGHHPLKAFVAHWVIAEPAMCDLVPMSDNRIGWQV